jgi:hypothetical protein
LQKYEEKMEWQKKIAGWVCKVPENMLRGSWRGGDRGEVFFYFGVGTIKMVEEAL